jgi:hypothetical protein
MRLTNPITGRSYLRKRLTVREGRRVRHRFWQPGGGYDRNFHSSGALRAGIDYFHANPVRRGLVAKAEDWEWSSARWYAGLLPVKIAMHDSVLLELSRDGLLDEVCKRGEIGEAKQ